jgi:hypothetical protein
VLLSFREEHVPGRLIMKIKFLRPVQGMAYWEDDVADIPDVKASRLVNSGFAIMIPETEGPVNKLPDNLPAREILFDNGLETIQDVQNAIDVLTDFDGIGKATAKKIKTFIDEL